MKKIILSLFTLILLLSFSACRTTDIAGSTGTNFTVAIQSSFASDLQSEFGCPSSDPIQSGTDLSSNAEPEGNIGISFSLDDVPPYADKPYTTINGNTPFFHQPDLTEESFENYSDLDPLGRCGTAYANIGKDLMPTEERGEIGQVKPSGWQTIKYDVIDGKYLYNRCHLIGYQLTAENANVCNLITGTRYLNIQGMLPFENMVADYIKETGNHVLYRVTPFFSEEELLARGVLMEALSVEDEGESICFCVFAYNVQPGIEIDYSTGMSSLQEEVTSVSEQSEVSSAQEPNEGTPIPENETYILNRNSKKFHYPWCSSVAQMKETNKIEYTGARDDVIKQGYEPCKRCNP